ncbi:hypothetical protein BJ508DRAFT_323002 [Ascobolus immersus RN42]|uniref:DUF1365-domain-containing protein n=1 Tax=Ascobolus immersus RN42 TaxID=1160509 RepID=A0A3N4IG94_ASCIM|nr:hypothetical protein BJ508DRAFT_323002 [Ascobolus immersus RN42]
MPSITMWSTPRKSATEPLSSISQGGVPVSHSIPAMPVDTRLSSFPKFVMKPTTSILPNAHLLRPQSTFFAETNSSTPRVENAAFEYTATPYSHGTLDKYDQYHRYGHFNQEAVMPSTYLLSTIPTVLLLLSLLLHLTSPTSKTKQPPKRPQHPQTENPPSPILYNCITSHRRTSPKKHAFTYRYMMTGFPIDLRGTIGHTISYGRAESGRQTIFTVDEREHLYRGEGSLRSKLNVVLRERGYNPEEYPLAYLVTAPKVFGFGPNPVSFWYLYDSQHTLRLLLFEANNTTGEKHLYLEPITPSTLTKNGTYKFHFTKRMFISPFSPAGGSYTIFLSDPLRQNLSVTIQLRDTDGTHLLTSSVRECRAGSVQVKDLSTLGAVVFLARVGYSGMLTGLRVLWQGFVLQRVRRLRRFDGEGGA